jgi:hypothetical protein
LRRKLVFEAVELHVGDLKRSGEIVLAALRRFCRADSSTVATSKITGMVDPLATMVAEGQRDVFYYIWEQLNLPDSALARMQEDADEERDDYAA